MIKVLATSTSASDHGNQTGITLSMRKRNISKEMEANKNFDNWLSLGRLIPRTSG
jgi:hypothetical protein